jgi:beta-glucosidase
MIRSAASLLAIVVACLSSQVSLAQTLTKPEIKKAQRRAAATVDRMTEKERYVLLHGVMPLPIEKHDTPLPADAVTGAGYVPGLARLGIPSLRETDASLGVGYALGFRKEPSTALPSGIAQAATWNRDLMQRGGAMIGSEARNYGFNVLLAGGVNLVRDPRSGRTFEYLSEDPLLSGQMVAASIRGIQSNGIISTIKHFALNGQETGRKFIDSLISERAAHESDLLAFRIGLEEGQPWSVMCAYNKVRGTPSCGNHWLLTDVLRKQWNYGGFVMSDWGSVYSVEDALAGLDQQSDAPSDAAIFFDQPLKAKAGANLNYRTRVTEMNRHILTAIYAAGLESTAPANPTGIDFDANARVAQDVAEQGIVLLRNVNNALPLTAKAKKILIVGGQAEAGVLSGGGSSQVLGKGGAAVVRTVGGSGIWTRYWAEQYHGSSPVDALKKQLPDAEITVDWGNYPSRAAAQAKNADVVIVFATQWMSEVMDLPDLSLPNGQDQLIARITEANPNTIVVLETGGPVTMPWLESTAAVVAAWYPGARGGEAIAAVLSGKVNPGGRLPVTFPRSERQLPRKEIDGLKRVDVTNLMSPPKPNDQLSVNYDIEGSDVGYRWFTRERQTPLFPFGFGLSYTSFQVHGISVKGSIAQVTVENTGGRTGDYVAQVYLTEQAGIPVRRLAGFERVSLQPGERRKVDVAINRYTLASWADQTWTIPSGRFKFATGANVNDLSAETSVTLKTKKWH